MRYAVLADVHGNLPALSAALSAAERSGAEGIVVLGDLVGYGAQPNECVELIRERGAVCVAGNHDLMAIGRLSDERCIAVARTVMRWTRRELSPSTRGFLEALPLTRLTPWGALLAHGSLDDPEAYTATEAQALSQLELLGRRQPRAGILLVGHTHRPLAVSRTRGRLAARGLLEIPEADAFLLNPGAVGQSRELSVRARALIFDPETRSATFLRVPYDLERARAALRAAGLPPGALHIRPRPRRLARVALTEARLLGAVLSRRVRGRAGAGAGSARRRSA